MTSPTEVGSFTGFVDIWRIFKGSATTESWNFLQTCIVRGIIQGTVRGLIFDKKPPFKQQLFTLTLCYTRLLNIAALQCIPWSLELSEARQFVSCQWLVQLYFFWQQQIKSMSAQRKKFHVYVSPSTLLTISKVVAKNQKMTWKSYFSCTWQNWDTKNA